MEARIGVGLLPSMMHGALRELRGTGYAAKGAKLGSSLRGGESHVRSSAGTC